MFFIALLAATVTIRDCGTPGNQATITSMGFSPENPNPGDATELWIAYDLKTPITGGTATYKYTYNGIPLPPTVEDLCTQTTCPKNPGSFNETSSSPFPSGVSGKVVTRIQWADQDTRPVWCVEATFKI
jgi:hypothetical protein